MTAPDSKLEDLVRNLVPIAALSAESQSELLASAEVKRFKRGESVFREGDSDPYSFFLIDGRLELLSGGQTIQRVIGGSPSAAQALAQLQPRKMTARAESEVKVLCVDRSLLERLSATTGGSSFGDTVEVNEIEADDGADWMTRMLQSKLFSQLPASNIQRIFSLLEYIEVKQGEIVVKQGEPGDFYYVIAQGRCEVTRASGPSASGYRLAQIGPGDAFGEEALVAGATRNATVRTLTDSELVRLPKEAFVELVQRPLLSGVTIEQARNIVAARNAIWLDVRFPEEHQRDGLADSTNHPLNTLRMHSGRLDSAHTYIVYCDTGARSAVAAFLLSERGFDVHYLEGGIARYGLAKPAQTAGAAEAENLDLTLQDDSAAATGTTAKASAPIPKSHQTAAEHIENPGIKAAVLTVELELSEMRIAESAARAEAVGRASSSDEASRAEEEKIAAQRAKTTAQIETARREGERQAAAAFEADRARAAAEIEETRRQAQLALEARLREQQERVEAAAAEARAELLEAQRIRSEAEHERAEATAAIERAEALRKTAQESLQTERKQQDEERLRAEKKRLEAAATSARRELIAARRIKADSEAALQRERAEQLKAAEEARVLEERERAAQAELIREQQTRLEAATADAQRQMIEAQRLQAQAETALERERAEQERLSAERKVADETRLQEEKARLEAMAADARRELLEAQRIKAEAQLARERAEQERIDSARRLQEEAQSRAERERLESVAAEAQRELLEAQRIKSEIELAKAEAEAAVERERAAQSAKVEQVRAEMERRLKEEERKLRENYAWQTDELRRLHAQKAEAEARLQEEQQRLQVQADESRAKLAEAREHLQRLEQTQAASAEEAKKREQQQVVLEGKLREELRNKVQTERQELEQELARNAIELQRARSEREAAEAARVAAADEAKRIVEGFKAAHARKRMQEEVDMRAERERLVADSNRLRLALEIAQHEKKAAHEAQNRVTAEIGELKLSMLQGSTNVQEDRAALAVLDAEALEIARKIEATERTRAEAQVAAVSSAGELAALKIHEEHARADLKDELDAWLRDQDQLERSDVQRDILTNQRAHMERIKKRSMSMREAAKAHDQDLIQELSDTLGPRDQK